MAILRYTVSGICTLGIYVPSYLWSLSTHPHLRACTYAVLYHRTCGVYHTSHPMLMPVPFPESRTLVHPYSCYRNTMDPRIPASRYPSCLYTTRSAILRILYCVHATALHPG